MSYSFHSKNILVTGAASGIGEAIAKSFSKAGANVYVVDLKLTDLQDHYADPRSIIFQVRTEAQSS